MTTIKFKRLLLTIAAAVIFLSSTLSIPTEAAQSKKKNTKKTETVLSLGELAEKTSVGAKLRLPSLTLDKAFESSVKAINAICAEAKTGKNGKKDSSKSSSTTSSGKTAERNHSDVLTYKYNPKMVKKVTDKEYEMLCRIVEAEAGDQDVYGRILVVNVILNRVNYKNEFPFDIEGVIFQKNQFAPIANGAYDRVTVDKISREAVDRALEGEDYSEGALYFIQRSCASAGGASYFDTLRYIFKYGCHEFYKY